VRTRNFLPVQLLAATALTLLCLTAASAQTMTARDQANNVAQPNGPAVAAVANEAELYCAGFIEYAPTLHSLQVVGGEQEQEQNTYGEGDYVFINAGANLGVHEGDTFLVARPRGQFTSKLSQKHGWLGVYTQEIGRLRVVRVKAQTSVALVTHSCDQIMLGDLLRSVPARTSPVAPVDPVFDRFGDASGKQHGRIVLARDGREMPSVSEVVFIDLGREDNVKEGDRLTIYRPAGRGNISRFRDEEVTPAASYCFESERFRGGKFSIKAPRVQDPNNNGVYGPIETGPKVKRKRPPVPRKVVGELVILNVQQRTATAIITRVAQEVHTGDDVEIQ
jgi:Flagellar assembly protein T, C-terminal domain